MRTRSPLYVTVSLAVFLLLLFSAFQPTRGGGIVALQLTWGGADNDVAQGVVIDQSGNIYVTGYTHSFGSTGIRAFVLKLNSSGGLTWQQTWGGNSGDFGRGIAVDSHGNVYVTGNTGSFGAGGNDIFLLKWNSAGTLLWQQTWGGAGDDLGFGVALDSSGNIYVSGYSTSLGSGTPEAVLLKFDTSGSLLWQRAWSGSTAGTRGQSVAVDSSGSIYVTGINSITGDQDAFILKFNSTNSLVWQRTWGGSGNDLAYGVAVDPSNNLYVTGSTQSGGAGSDDAFILKLSSAGGMLWQRTWGGPSVDQARARGISVDSLGYVYVTGYTSSSGGTPSHSFILSLDSTGSLLWQTLWGGSLLNSNDQGLGVAAAGGGFAVTTGLVSEAANYSTISVSASFQTPSLGLGTPNNAPTLPTLSTTPATGIVVSVSGSLNYAGGQDAFLLKYGAPSPPSPPTNFEATGHQGYVNLTWSPPAFNGFNSVTGYKIYRGTSSGAETLLTAINQTSYKDSAIIGGTTYYYKVTALNSIGESNFSPERSATPTSKPTPPVGLSAAPTVGHVTLSWSPPASDGGSPLINYKLYRGTAPGGENLLATIGTGTSYTDGAVAGGTTYYYKVTALNALGESDPSNEASGTPTSAPTPPQNLQAIPSLGKIVLTWRPPFSNGGSPVNGYNLYRGTTSGSEHLLVQLQSQLIYSDNGLNANITYFYEVKAVNSIGVSAFSNEASATPSGNFQAPSAPQNLVATAGKGNVTLTWSPPLSNGGEQIIGYFIYRGNASHMEILYAYPDNSTSFIDSSINIGTTYYYQVTAFNRLGEGPASNEASAKPFTTPSAPQNLQAVGGFAKIYLVWRPPANDGARPITGYMIYRGNASGAETLLTAIGNQTSFIDTSINNGTKYFYEVTAVNIAGQGPPSSEAAAGASAVRIAPSPPQNLVASGGISMVSLTWSPPISNGGISIRGYEVWRGTTSGAETRIATIGNQTSYTDKGLLGGITYFYVVKAVNSIGPSDRSDEATAKPVSPPTAPGNLVSIGGVGNITLTWSAPASSGGSPVTGYNIYRGTSSGGETLLATVGNVNGYVDATATIGITYYYQVTALNSLGESIRSDEANASSAQPPQPPTNLTATPGINKITLTWIPPSDNGGSSITSYLIYRGTSLGSETLLIPGGVGNVTSYVDNTVRNGTTYYYFVKAINNVGPSNPSNEVSASPQIPPNAPLNLKAAAAPGIVNLTWSPPSPSKGAPDIIGYKIYRGPSVGGEVLLATVMDVTFYIDTSVTSGTTYFYRITAVNSVGQSAFSSEVSIAVPPTFPIIAVAIAALIIVAVGALGVILWRRRVSRRLMMPP